MALFLLGFVPGCDSGTRKSDGGSVGGGQTGTGGATSTGAAGTAGAGAGGEPGPTGAGATGSGGAGAAGTGSTGTAGAAGTHGSGDGGAGNGAAGRDGGATTPAKDASTDGQPLGYCDLDTDCTSRYSTNCSCTQTCVAKTAPMPPPPKTECLFACPTIAFPCSCVNHQCAFAEMGVTGSN
jgi:hypothetical protein